MAILFMPSCTMRKVVNKYDDFLKYVPPPELKVVHKIFLSDSLLRDSLSKFPSMIEFFKSSKNYQVLSVHDPYLKRKCFTCHDKETNKIKVKNSNMLCLDCHEQFKNLPGYVHGPLGVSECNACHDPHLSTYQSLLVRNGKFLCIYCHENLNLFVGKEHENIDSKSCLDCHLPHNSMKNRFFVKKY